MRIEGIAAGPPPLKCFGALVKAVPTGWTRSPADGTHVDGEVVVAVDA